jgi:hypothetical protein
MYEGEFSHHGGKCNLRGARRSFRTRTPVVAWIGEIVHDLDMKDQRHGRPEAAAIGPMIEGLRRMHGDDNILLVEGIAMFEALARGFESDPDGTARAAGKASRTAAIGLTSRTEASAGLCPRRRQPRQSRSRERP